MSEKYIWSSKKYWMWFPITFTKYALTEERFLKEKGFIKNVYDEIYLYRVMDVKLERSIWQKMFGTGTITLYSSDASQTVTRIENIKNSFEIKELISKMVLEQRKAHRVLEYSGSSIDFTDSDGNGIPDFVE